MKINTQCDTKTSFKLWRICSLICWISVLGGATLHAQDTASAQQRPPLMLDFYYTPGCAKCEPTVNLITTLREQYAGQLVVTFHNLRDNPDMVVRFFEALDHAGISSNETPSMAAFINEYCFAGSDPIHQDLEKTILRLLDAAQNTTNNASNVRTASQPLDQTRALAPLNTTPKPRMTFWAVTLAALADGINPCACATAILFLSMLSVGRHRRSMIFMVGVTYISSVFITYFLIGLALFESFRLIMALEDIGRILMGIMIVMAAYSGYLSLADAIRIFRGGDPRDSRLTLPHTWRDAIRKRLGHSTRSRHIIPAVAITGILVTIVESACTGQVYLPVIAGMIRDGTNRAQGMLWLGWYVGLFVMPLVLIFGAGLMGVSPTTVGGAYRRRAGTVRLVMGILFLGLAGWLLQQTFLRI